LEVFLFGFTGEDIMVFVIYFWSIGYFIPAYTCNYSFWCSCIFGAGDTRR